MSLRCSANWTQKNNIRSQLGRYKYPEHPSHQSPHHHRPSPQLPSAPLSPVPRQRPVESSPVRFVEHPGPRERAAASLPRSRKRIQFGVHVQSTESEGEDFYGRYAGIDQLLLLFVATDLVPLPSIGPSMFAMCLVVAEDRAHPQRDTMSDGGTWE